MKAEAASDTLVALSRNHFSLVMYELQHHLKPLDLTDEFVIVTLAKLANGNGKSADPGGPGPGPRPLRPARRRLQASVFPSVPISVPISVPAPHVSLFLSFSRVPSFPLPSSLSAVRILLSVSHSVLLFPLLQVSLFPSSQASCFSVFSSPLFIFPPTPFVPRFLSFRSQTGAERLPAPRGHSGGRGAPVVAKGHKREGPGREERTSPLSRPY